MNIPNNFNDILQMVIEKSPLQKKKINSFITEQSDEYYLEAEEFSTQYIDYLKSQNIPTAAAVDCYLKMCTDTVKSQLHFMRTGKYPLEDASDAYSEVYDNESEMKSYMIGLALSQFLWLTHYEMYSFLKKYIHKSKNSITNYLEIGPGHGLFLKAAIDIIDNNKSKFTAIDISKTSIGITKSIINHFYNEEDAGVKYHAVNMLDIELSNQYDFITMGEVLEHVNNPEVLMKKLGKLLTTNGKAFISTCVDCPTIDHVFHFKSIPHIREMIQDCGLKIIDEKVLPVEKLPMAKIVKCKIAINYCAIIERVQ